MAGPMPWELDKPVQQPVAAPWEMDAPVNAAQPKVKPVAEPVRQPVANLFGDVQPSAARLSTNGMSDLLMSAPDRGAAPVDSRPLEQVVADADPTGERTLRSNAYLGQAVRKGAVDLADMIIDPIRFNFNLTSDALFGDADPVAVPMNTSTLNTIIDENVPTVSDQDVSARDRMTGTALRGATAAGLGGLALKAAGAPAYATNAGKVLSGDVLAGAGSGVGLQGYDEFVPDSVKSAIGPLGQIMAAVLGGISGATLNSAGHGLVDAATGAARDSMASRFGMFTDPSTPVNPDTGVAYKPSEMDMAARIAQNMPSDVEKTVRNIRSGVQDFGQTATPDQMPTTGMLADDVGMSLNEKVARTKNPQRFAERDAARNALASDKIKASAPAGADGQDMVNAATRQYDDAIGAARNRLETARVAEASGAEDIARQNAALREAQLRQGDASSALDTEFRRQNEAATAEKNARYAGVSQDTPVPAKPLYEELMAIENSVPRAARVGTDYAGASKRIRDLITEVDPATGNTKFRDLTYGDAKVLKTEIGALRQEAVAAGRDVSHLDKLNGLLSGVIDEINPEAKRYYAEEFAPRFRTGKAGEYSQALKRAVKTGEESSGTRPSEFGQKFLTKPEDANALQRAIDVNGNPVTAQNATEWMMGDLAKSNVLNGNAEIRYDRFRQWANKNRAVIDQFPAMRQRVDQELARAEQGGRLSRQLASDVRTAEQNLNMTETDLRRSALQNAIGNDPENTIASIMNAGDPAAKMGDMVKRLSGDQKATDGLKAAVRDWITGKASTTSKNVGFPDTEKFSRAALDRLFSKHEKTLAKVYTPEEMNSLRQAHKLLDVAANLDVKVTAGSDTFQNFLAAGKDTMTKRNRMLEAALKAKYGVLKGGGYFRTMRLFFDALGSMSSSTRNVENVLTEVWFNPELAQHLMTRNVKEIGTPAWNSKLNRLLAVAAGNRDDDDVENTDQKGSTK